MKQSIKFLATFVFFSTLLTSCSNNEPKAPESTTPYETVENDPMKARIYTMDNGMKVYLSVNKDEPRIQTMVAVRTGSKQDPSNATGLAHYLEHMLFKGTSQFGTVNWEEEQKLLLVISDFFEENHVTDDPELRKAIYHKIDSVSQLAARLAVANEYDKMIGSLGAEGTNAFTSLERTVYINDIPSNELEKWLMIESERFSELVLRLFHTELEAVYEEFNRAQDSDFRTAYYALMENLFQKHTYGTQSTIGTGEHLKKPSMVKIHNYFNTYYVPNNMAIVLAGDFDPEATFQLINKYFGHYEAKEVPKFTFTPEDPITEPIIKDVFGKNAEFLQMGYRLDGIGSKDALYLQLLDGVLNNGQAGLIDLNLLKKQKVLRARSSANINADYSMLMLSGTPRNGQTLEEVRELLLAQLEAVKAGDFEDWLIDAVVKDLKLNDSRFLEYNRFRTSNMMDAFIMEQDWADVVKEKDELAKITKEDLMAWTKEKFHNNYVAINKREGEKEIYKVEKPEITPIDIDRDTTSTFYTKVDTMESKRLEPVFVNYQAAIDNSKLGSGVPFSYIKNTTNELFELYYILDMGTDNDKEMALAVSYLPFLGTEKYSAEQLQQEFFKLGLRFDVFTSTDRVYVSLQGLESSLEEGVQLFEELLDEVKADPEAYQSLVNDQLKERNDRKKNKGQILFRGMSSYAKYGEDSPFRNLLSEEALKNMDPKNLVEKLKTIDNYQHRIFYYGTKSSSDVVAVLDKYHQVPETLLDYPAAKTYVELDNPSNKVYFVDYDMVQSEMMMISKVGPFDKAMLGPINLFNQYFGSGLSSIVFQEIRESKALAYSARCSMTSPNKKEDAHYVSAYIGTQVDKLGNASAAMLELMNNMPEAEIQFEDSKLSALKQMETERITKSSIFWSYESAKRLGLDYDVRKESYAALQEMSLQDMKVFFDKNLKGRNYTFCVIGKRSEIDMEVLKELGPVQELTLEQLFGY